MFLSRMPATLILVLSCLIGMLVAQTFQYSRGWTNGRKRSSIKSPREIDCQMQQLRAILEGKGNQALFWPCAWQAYPELNSHVNPPPPVVIEQPDEN